ncbi:MAG: hypothetical protein IKS52_04640 [Clostridia bacterium]|nr:hypothetical protein [Clostridia bacterium]
MKPGRKPKSGAGLSEAERERLLVTQMMGLDDGDVADPNKAFRALLPYQSPRILDIYRRILRGEDWNAIAAVWHTNAETIKGFANVLHNHGYNVKTPPEGWRAERVQEQRMGRECIRLNPDLCEQIKARRAAGAKKAELKAEFHLSEYDIGQIYSYIKNGYFQKKKRRRAGVQDTGGEAQQ